MHAISRCKCTLLANAKYQVLSKYSVNTQNNYKDSYLYKIATKLVMNNLYKYMVTRIYMYTKLRKCSESNCQHLMKVT